jgi:hypothetical protein
VPGPALGSRAPKGDEHASERVEVDVGAARLGEQGGDARIRVALAA